jgi:hypothetical protein
MPVEVKGVIELRKALRAYAPDLAKQLNQDLGATLKPIVKKSRSYLPSNDQVISNWVGTQGRDQGRFPQYDASVARRGVVYKTTPTKRNRKGFKNVITIFNKSAAGAIYETAGRKTPSSLFVKNLSGKSYGVMKGQDKMRGKVIYRAWEEDQGKARDAVLRAIDKAIRAFEVRSKTK